jgi:hypothetical protein
MTATTDINEISFQTVSPGRVGPVMGLVQLVFITLLLFGGTELRILGASGLLLSAYSLLIRRGSVTVSSLGCRIRTHVWTEIRFSEIAEVKRYEFPPFPEWKRWLYGPSFEVILETSAAPSIGIYLKSHRWIFSKAPIPIFMRVDVVRVNLDEDDEKRFLSEMHQRLQLSSDMRDNP